MMPKADLKKSVSGLKQESHALTISTTNNNQLFMHEKYWNTLW